MVRLMIPVRFAMYIPYTIRSITPIKRDILCSLVASENTKRSIIERRAVNKSIGVILPTERGVIIPLHPSINRILAMLEPIILPIRRP